MSPWPATVPASVDPARPACRCRTASPWRRRAADSHRGRAGDRAVHVGLARLHLRRRRRQFEAGVSRTTRRHCQRPRSRRSIPPADRGPRLRHQADERDGQALLRQVIAPGSPNTSPSAPSRFATGTRTSTNDRLGGLLDLRPVSARGRRSPPCRPRQRQAQTLAGGRGRWTSSRPRWPDRPACRGDEGLGPVGAHCVAVAHRRRSHARQVGPVPGLGHGHGRRACQRRGRGPSATQRFT